MMDMESLESFDLWTEASGSSRRASQNNYFNLFIYFFPTDSVVGELGDLRDLSLQHCGE